MPKLIRKPDKGVRPATAATGAPCVRESRRVSVVVTARNYGRFLGEALESAVRQTVPCEVVYSDDFSQDDSVAVARRFEDRGVLVLTAQRHLGVVAARNRGALAATGDLLVHLDGDDVMPPDFVQAHLDAMAPGVPFVYGPATAFGEGPRAGSHWGVPEWNVADIWAGNSVNTSAMYDRRVFEAVGGWQEGVGTMWDWDLALRAMRLGTPRASKADLRYRQHPESWSHRLAEFEDGPRRRLQRKMRRRHLRLSIGSVYSGRLPETVAEWLSRILDGLLAPRPPLDLTILDNSNSEGASQALADAVGRVSENFITTRIVPWRRRYEWTDEKDRRNKVAGFMASACNELLRRSTGDVLWVVEDDVLVADGAGDTLLHSLCGPIPDRQYGCPHAVSGAYRSRHGERYYIAGWRRGDEWPHVENLPQSLTPVDYAGTGCLMFWKNRPSVPAEFQSHHDGVPAHDWAWGMALKAGGGALLLDPAVRCGHRADRDNVVW